MFEHVFRLAHPGGSYKDFGEVHRLPAIFYLQFSFLGLVLAALSAVAILVILLPSLHRKMPTLLVGMTAIFTGTVAGYGLIIPEWQVGSLRLPSQNALVYKPHHTEVLLDASIQPSAELGLRIGLSGANFTLVHSANENHTFYWDERIEFDSLDGMFEQYKASLERGLPVAILELQEQVVGCVYSEFKWPFQLRRAGYYCSWLLAAVLTTWAISCLLMVVVPKLGAVCLGTTGTLLLAVPLLYTAMVPVTSGPAGRDQRVAGVAMPLHFGSSMWVCLAGGIWTSSVGLALFLRHSHSPHEFYTDFDLDYDQFEDQRLLRMSIASNEELGTPQVPLSGSSNVSQSRCRSETFEIPTPKNKEQSEETGTRQSGRFLETRL